MTKQTNRKRRGNRKAGNRSGRGNPLRQAGPEGGARTSENMAALKMVKSFKGPNNKYINSLYGAINVSPVLATPGIVLLNGVGQGTNENTRIGRLAKMKWLDLDLIIETNLAASGIEEMRVYIVVETTCLGSALAPSQFFVDAAAFGPTSQRDRTNRNASRYVVLFDSKTFSIGSLPYASALANVAWTGTSPQTKHFNIHLPLNFSTDYSRGNSGTVSDIETNSLYLMILTDDGTASRSLAFGGYTLCFSDDQ